LTSIGDAHDGRAPGAVPVTSTQALTNATLPYVLALADLGVERALEEDAGLRCGLNVTDGEVVHPVVAAELLDARSGLPLAAAA
jgi:alanine dehydrogenase